MNKSNARFGLHLLDTRSPNIPLICQIGVIYFFLQMFIGRKTSFGQPAKQCFWIASCIFWGVSCMKAYIIHNITNGNKISIDKHVDLYICICNIFLICTHADKCKYWGRWIGAVFLWECARLGRNSCLVVFINTKILHHSSANYSIVLINRLQHFFA